MPEACLRDRVLTKLSKGRSAPSPKISEVSAWLSPLVGVHWDRVTVASLEPPALNRPVGFPRLLLGACKNLPSPEKQSLNPERGGVGATTPSAGPPGEGPVASAWECGAACELSSRGGASDSLDSYEP